MTTDSEREEMQSPSDWYKDAVIYEVHVRAFADSDGDGIGDACEPVAAADFDSDGLSDAEEAILGTHPRKADTDKDGLTDNEEVRGIGGPTSDPRRADADHDGLNDSEERTNG
ncbi:MAG TPA: thrombospondin type 3 repeat-containing protein, partial [Dehalococcoidia bacterium]|nr:thrombospondin type 3 repeat-containing protein [Dehalococcoidia bacterium]